MLFKPLAFCLAHGVRTRGNLACFVRALACLSCTAAAASGDLNCSLGFDLFCMSAAGCPESVFLTWISGLLMLELLIPRMMQKQSCPTLHLKSNEDTENAEGLEYRPRRTS
jgi:hypothetical protein